MKIRNEAGQLALILGCKTSTAEKLYRSYGSTIKIISEDSRLLAANNKGVDEEIASKHAAIKSIFNLAYNVDSANSVVQLMTPEDVYKMMRLKVAYLKQEEVWIICLSHRNTVNSVRMINRGTSNSCTISAPDVLREAILASSTKMIMVHNHPSGDEAPSDEDILVTKRVIDAGEAVGISLVDHIIISGANFHSMREEDHEFIKFFD